MTGFEGKLYADNSRALFQQLGMKEHLLADHQGRPKPSYAENQVMTILKSMGVSSPPSSILLTEQCVAYLNRPHELE